MNTKIEKRNDFDTTTERETIFVQNICFLDVAIDKIDKIIKNEILKIVFDELINNVNINVNSLDEKNVANDIDIAIIAFDVSIDTTNDCFDVKKM